MKRLFALLARQRNITVFLLMGIAFIEIAPFSLEEIPSWEKPWIQGGFPKSYLSPSKDSFYWRTQYIKTTVEQE
jgi:predicted AAA+ superfamily ATPase